MIYLVIYGVLAAMSAVEIMGRNERRDTWSAGVMQCVAWAMLAMLAGLRFETGGDWEMYNNIFEFTDEWWIQHIDVGFRMLCKAVKFCGGESIQSVYLLVAVVDLGIITIALRRYTRYVVTGLLIYYGTAYFSLEMVYTRQAIVSAVGLYALRWVEERKFWRWTIFVALGMLMHKSAVVLWSVYFVAHRRYGTWTFVGALSLGVGMMMGGVGWLVAAMQKAANLVGGHLGEHIEGYIDVEIFAVRKAFSIGAAVYLALTAYVLMRRRAIEAMPYGRAMLNVFFINILAYFYLYELAEVNGRMRLYFITGMAALLPMIVEGYKPWAARQAVALGFALWGMVMARGVLLNQPDAIAYHPYQCYLTYRHHPWESTGRERLHEGDRQFRENRIAGMDDEQKAQLEAKERLHALHPFGKYTW